MRYLCLVYGTEGSLPVMQNPNPMSRAEVYALTQTPWPTTTCSGQAVTSSLLMPSNPFGRRLP
jgi:hypothetical protein